MAMKSLIQSIAAAAIVLAVIPASATSVHNYGQDEYAIIDGGLSPDKRLSLAAHGEGEMGDENFHVWLMEEPAHSKIAALDGISSDNNLDTGAQAYQAYWSRDSRRVGLTFRVDRHVVQLNLYAIENHKPYLISGPSLFKQATGHEIGDDDEVRRSIPEVEWRGPQRFVLREHDLFRTADTRFLRRLGAYGHINEKLDNGLLMVEFSVEAHCVLLPGNRYQVVKIRPGRFGAPGSW